MEQKKYTLYPKIPAPKKRPKREKHFSDYVVIISLIAVILYTIAVFSLLFDKGIEPSATLTTSYFAFFGVELASLAAIKYGKTKHGNKTETEGKFNEHQE